MQASKYAAPAPANTPFYIETLDSTEIFKVGVSSGWTEVSPLPLTLTYPRASTVNNLVYLTGEDDRVESRNFISLSVSGGVDSNWTIRNEIYMFHNDGWLLVSHMITPRIFHEVSTIIFDQELAEDCIPVPSSTSTNTIINTKTFSCDDLCSGRKAVSHVGA